MTNHTEINTSLINEWMSDRLSQQEIEKKLIHLGYDAHKRAEHIRAYDKLKHAKRQYVGFMLSGIGALLGFISCVFTMINLTPELTNFFLYGLTSISIVLVMIGLYFVFE